MSPEIEKEFELLRTIYRDIVLGYSFHRGLGLYIKHLDEFDIASLFDEKHNLLSDKDANTLPTYSERRKQLLESGDWSEAQDEKILELETQIKDNEDFLSKIPIQAQKDALLPMIKKLRNELTQKQIEKSQLFGPTLERYIDKTANNNMMLRSFFKDPELSIRALTEKDIDEIYEETNQNYYDAYEWVHSKLVDSNINKIACLNFFTAPLSYIKDRPETFFQKPFYKLTMSQFSLLARGVRNLSAMSESKTEPPSLNTIKSFDELIKWFDVQYSIMIGKRGGSGDEYGIKKSRKTVTK